MFRNSISFVSICFYFLLNVLCAQALSDGPPTAPTNVQAVAHTSYQPQVVITWNQAMDTIGVTRYNIYRNGTFLFSPKGVGVTYTDFDVVAGQTYTYSIQAGDGDGNNGPQSEIVQITVYEGGTSRIATEHVTTQDTGATTIIPVPTIIYTNTNTNDISTQVTNPDNVRITAYENQLVISWKNPQGNKFKSVRVIKKIASFPSSVMDGTIICDALLEQCVDKDVAQERTYYYGVYAVNESYLASKLTTVSGSPKEKQAGVMIPTSTTHVVTTTNLVTSSKASFTKTLKLGSVGEEVFKLQKFLNTQGFTVSVAGPGSKGNETTTFGKATEKALRAYQCKKKIVCEGTVEETGYGMVGKTTRFNLNKDLLTQ